MDQNHDSYLGQVAYEGYRVTSGGVSLVSNDELPAWVDLDPKIQTAWSKAAQAVESALVKPQAVEEIKLDEAHADEG